MQPRLSTLLGGILVALALVGLLPVLTKVLGAFTAATVVIPANGNFTPTTQDTPFIQCVHIPTTGYNHVRLNDQNTTSNLRVMRCTNHFPFDVTIAWQLVNANGMKVSNVSGSATVPAGAQNYCTGGLNVTTGGGGGARPVVFQGVINQPTLYAVFQFPVPIEIGGKAIPTQC